LLAKKLVIGIVQSVFHSAVLVSARELTIFSWGLMIE